MSFWPQEFHENREWVVARQRELVKWPKSWPGEYLHLGCGQEFLPEWVNVDKFPCIPGVRMMDMFHLPEIPSHSVNVVYSNHSLEHLPIRKARMALREWHRVLNPSGRLVLAVPDLEVCCATMQRTDVSYEHKWNWFIYTLFGYQVNTNERSRELDLPEDEGQFHKTGFSKEFLRRELAEIGFEVTILKNYDGNDTPSIWVEAVKDRP